MRAATVSVGLVSPRSTCESIGALTPLRSARSRSDSPADSRSAFTRAPITAGDSAEAGDSAAAASVGVSEAVAVVVIRAYVITDTGLCAPMRDDALWRRSGGRGGATLRSRELFDTTKLDAGPSHRR